MKKNMGLKGGLAALLLIAAAERSEAQLRLDLDEEPKMLYYESTHPVKKLKDARDFRDILHKNKYLLGRRRILGNIAFNTGRVLVDDGKEKHEEVRRALSLYTRIRFFEEFSLNTNFYFDFNRKADARWISDYEYSIGRYNWRGNRVNFGYENYINNKYTDSWSVFSEKFVEGWYFISYNYIPAKLNAALRLDSTTNLKLIPFVRYSVHYRDENEVVHGDLLHGKPTTGLAMRYTIFRGIYAEAAVYYYFRPEHKQPWDPDYTYGFGYFDWRSFRLSLTYGNWGINRFPWNKTSYPRYDVRDGVFRLVLNWMW